MIRVLSIIAFLAVLFSVNAQKGQRIGYIDMNYILDNIPQYLEAQNALNSKVDKWKNDINTEKKEIESLKIELENEKAILTDELIEERKEDIRILEEEHQIKKNQYFGPEGSMYTLRRQLIKPIQDQVYNAINSIASKKKYDFIFDKSSELIMLYTNNKHDISELVLKSINIDVKRKNKAKQIKEKRELLKEKRKKQKATVDPVKQAKINEINKRREAIIKEREAKRKLLLEKREALKKAREEKNKKENK